jgi:RNA polymerase sigma-70 factor (ECF subfamily)
LTRIVQIDNEQQLIAECRKWNERSMKTLYDRYAPRMMSVCLRYMREKNAAEDVLQEGFVKVFRHLKEFRNEGPLEGWIRRIMVTTALTAMKKSKKMQEFTESGSVSFEPEIEPSVLGQFSSDELMNEIANLPDGYRTVLNLFAIEGFSHYEIGQLLGIHESSSRSQYTRAKKLLHTRIKRNEIFSIR